MFLSAQHRILVNSQIARHLFGASEVFVAAKHLVGLRGIDQHVDTQGADYFHILLDSHEIVFANGAACESLFLGAEAIKTVGADILNHSTPSLAHLQSGTMSAGPCRPVLSARQARALSAVHRAKGGGFLQAGPVFEQPVSGVRSAAQRLGPLQSGLALLKVAS